MRCQDCKADAETGHCPACYEKLEAENLALQRQVKMSVAWAKSFRHAQERAEALLAEVVKNYVKRPMGGE